MRHTRFPIIPRRAALWMLAILLLLQTLTACQTEQPSAEDTGTVTLEQTAGNGILTLSPEATPEEPEPLPSLTELQAGVNYRALVITSYYATGRAVPAGSLPLYQR